MDNISRRRFFEGSLFASFFVCVATMLTCEIVSGQVIEPQTVELDAAVLARIDVDVEAALRDKKMPGCVVCIGRHGKIAFLKAYGNKQVTTENTPAIPMTTDTLFDLASLTKPIATATSVMILVEQDKLKLDAPVADYLDEFKTPEKKTITVRQLLLHTAGFIPDNHLKDYQDGSEKAHERLLALNPVTEPGKEFKYSDVSFQILGLLIERVSGQRIDEFAADRIFKPLGMRETGFMPNETLSRKAAPTQDRELGQVHDPRAFLTNRVAGHAGLFSTAEDLAIYSDMLLGDKKNSLTQILTPKTLQTMTTPHPIASGYRGLGWDMQSAYSGNRGKTMSPKAFGHGGFTGTAIWIDPAFDLFVIFLSNRVHPDGKGNVNALAGTIGTIAVDAVLDLPTSAEDSIKSVRKEIDGCLKNVEQAGLSGVLPGIDVLRANRFAPLSGKRVGLITNHTGLTHDGTSIVKILSEAPDVKLIALFGPEHGFSGIFDQSKITDSRDPLTGLTVYSLYGTTRKPTPSMLENVDVLVFDIQDIGTRFYTYIGTMLACMEAASMKGIPFVVLDRPNPIGGLAVEGPLPDPGRETFVGCCRIPLRHGMTVGELALMLNVQRRLGLELHVVPCAGWTRKADQAATGLTWVNPSPNMRSLAAAYLYPGVGLLEFTNISVGRGTEKPFEWIGAPWIDGEKLADELTADVKQFEVDGVHFEAYRQTPDASKYAKVECGGVRILLDDPQTLRPVRLGIVLAKTLHRLYPDQWETKNLNTLWLRDQTVRMILNGCTVKEIEADWQTERKQFERCHELFLLYK